MEMIMATESISLLNILAALEQIPQRVEKEMVGV